MKNPIFIDQYHIDIMTDNKTSLSKAELKLITDAFKETNWLAVFIQMQFPKKLQDKIKIEITR